jgi:hypothetical protein
LNSQNKNCPYYNFDNNVVKRTRGKKFILHGKPRKRKYEREDRARKTAHFQQFQAMDVTRVIASVYNSILVRPLPARTFYRL